MSVNIERKPQNGSAFEKDYYTLVAVKWISKERDIGLYMYCTSHRGQANTAGGTVTRSCLDVQLMHLLS